MIAPQDSSQRPYLLRVGIAVLLIFAAGVVVLRSSEEGNVHRSALFRLSADADVWATESEQEFRKSIAVRARHDKEQKFVELLVNEWKLSKTLGKRGDKNGQSLSVGGDANWFTGEGSCSQPLGGGGGHFHQYIRSNDPKKVVKFCVRSGSLIDQIEVHFEGGVVFRRGGWGGGYRCFSVPHNECISKVNIRTGRLVDGLQLITNTNRHSPWFGGHGGHYHHVYSNACLRGIKCRTGSLVDQISFCFTL